MTTDELKDNGANKQKQWVFQNKRKSSRQFFLVTNELNQTDCLAPSWFPFGRPNREHGFFVLETDLLREMISLAQKC